MASRMKQYTYEHLDQRMEMLDDAYLDLLRADENFTGTDVTSSSGNSSSANTTGKGNILTGKEQKYLVGENETLLTIAEKFHAGPSAIAELNDNFKTTDGIPQAGQTILLPDYAVNVPPFIEDQQNDKPFYDQPTGGDVLQPIVPSATGIANDYLGYVITLPTEPEYTETYGIYYGKIVPAIAVVTKSRKEAQDFAVSKGYRFYYDVNPVTRKRSILRQPNATEIYNQEHYGYSAELVDEVNSAANDATLAQKVKTEQTLGTSFTQLVKKAQDNPAIWGPNYKNIGMYDGPTRDKVKILISSGISSISVQSGVLSKENLSENIKKYSTDAQQNVIVRLSDTNGVYGVAKSYKNYISENNEAEVASDVEKVLKYRQIGINWSTKQWGDFVTNSHSDQTTFDVFYCVTRTAYDEAVQDGRILESQKPYFESRHFFNQWWAGDPDYVNNPVRHLGVIIALENTSYYGGLVGGKIESYSELITALNAFLADADDNKTTEEHTKGTAGSDPNFKAFFENYMYQWTSDYLTNAGSKVSSEFTRFANTGTEVSPDMKLLMADLNNIYPFVQKADEYTAEAEKFRTPGWKGSTAYSSGSEPWFKKRNEQHQKIWDAFNPLRTKYPILSSSEYEVNDAEITEIPKGAFDWPNGATVGLTFIKKMIRDAHNNDANSILVQLQRTYTQKSEAITKLQNDIKEDPTKMWLLDRLVEGAKADAGFAQSSAFSEMIDTWKTEKGKNDSWVSTLLQLGFLFLSIFMPIFLVGVAAVSGYNLYQDIKDYNFKNAAANTAYDPNEALGPPPPVFVVLLDAAMLALDIVFAWNPTSNLFKSLWKTVAGKIITRGAITTEKLVVEQLKEEILQTLLKNGWTGTEQDAKLLSEKLTDAEFLKRIQQEQAERETLLKANEGKPLPPMSESLKSALSASVTGDYLKVGMYRLQAIKTGETDMFQLLLRTFDETEPLIMNNILKTAGESNAMATMFGTLYEGMSKQGSEKFIAFIRTELSRPVNDTSALFRRMANNGITQEEIEAAAKVAGEGTGEFNLLFRTELLSKLELKEASLLNVDPLKPKEKPGKVDTPVSESQLQLEDAIDKMSAKDAQTFLNDLEKMKAKMPKDEYDALKKRAEDQLNAVFVIDAKYATTIDDKVRLLAKEKLFANDAETFLDSEYRTR